MTLLRQKVVTNWTVLNVSVKDLHETNVFGSIGADDDVMMMMTMIMRPFVAASNSGQNGRRSRRSDSRIGILDILLLPSKDFFDLEENTKVMLMWLKSLRTTQVVVGDEVCFPAGSCR